MATHQGQPHGPPSPPRLIAWELTRRCVLACKHCRAAAGAEPSREELSTAECLRLVDNIASFAKPILILTGGEPMLREDLCDIAVRARQAGMRPVLASCGMLLNGASAALIARSGVEAVAISLDGATAKSHDAFRGMKGAFDAALAGLAAARRAGLRVQVNTTVTRDNVGQLPAILELAVRLGAATFNPFFLVPTGRGAGLAGRQLSAEEYEKTLCWLAGVDRKDIQLRVTCAPHYQRILRQQGSPAEGGGGGCLGGKSFAFISHRGKVQVCGFLDLECGDLRLMGLDFHRIWETSEVFTRLRDSDSLRGRCGRCEFRRPCGGCRARAYAMTGDYLGEEPFCAYQPKERDTAQDKPHGARPVEVNCADLDPLDRKLLTIVQDQFPITAEPMEVLAQRLGADGDEILARLQRLKQAGFIRRIGAVFEPAGLGYTSCLVTGRVDPTRLDAVAEAVNVVPEVTHNYARGHEYNLWFALTAASQERIAQAVRSLARQTGVEFRMLPALAVYKINAVFRLDGSFPIHVSNRPECLKAVNLTEEQKLLVGVLQGDLGVTARPFDAPAALPGWSEQSVIGQIAGWLSSGLIRRFGAVVAHRRLGFHANGLAVFAAKDDRVDLLGRRLAQLPQVSHCYRRRPFPGWGYNLFAMFHGFSQEQVRRSVDEAAARMGLKDYEVLFSTTEYKKTSATFFHPGDGGADGRGRPTTGGQLTL